METAYADSSVLAIEKYRPKEISDFIGNEQPVNTLQLYLEGHIEADGAILVGQPGTGKTTVSHVLGDALGFEVMELNASDQRRKTDAVRVSKIARTQSITMKPPLLVLDECESATKEFLSTMLDKKVMTILITNEIDKVHWSIRQRCTSIEFKQPSKSDYRKLLKRLGVDDAPIDRFRSWRDCHNWLAGGEPLGIEYLSEKEQISRHFAGDRINLGVDPARVIDYYVYNGGDPDIASYADRLVHDGRTRDGMEILRGSKVSSATPWIWYPKAKKRDKGRSTAIVVGFL